MIKVKGWFIKKKTYLQWSVYWNRKMVSLKLTFWSLGREYRLPRAEFGALAHWVGPVWIAEVQPSEEALAFWQEGVDFTLEPNWPMSEWHRPSFRFNFQCWSVNFNAVCSCCRQDIYVDKRRSGERTSQAWHQARHFLGCRILELEKLKSFTYIFRIWNRSCLSWWAKMKRVPFRHPRHVSQPLLPTYLCVYSVMGSNWHLWHKIVYSRIGNIPRGRRGTWPFQRLLILRPVEKAALPKHWGVIRRVRSFYYESRSEFACLADVNIRILTKYNGHKSASCRRI